jgi:signal transduction histidine kinase
MAIAVLNRVTAAIAIYGADRRLNFFNLAFAQLWRLEEDWLSRQPLVEEVMDRLRERRRLPEVADFRAFRRNLVAQFTSLIAPQEELLHLPDDKTLRLVVSPHPQGGLIFAYEDVTGRFALERSYNTAIEVQRETLDHLYEGIAVFGSDGRLKLSNPAYAQMWGLTPEDLGGEPHVSQLAEKFHDFLDDGGDWSERKARVVARLTADRASSMTLNRRDGSVLQAVTLPLPDGNTLLSYLDVTDTTRVENALRERTDALEAAGRLKSEFLANVSYELRTPLTSITGYAEMLTGNYAGELAPRQLEYASNILESAQAFTRLVDDILDLATIEAGYMELDTSAVDIQTMLQNVLTLQQAQARNLGLRLEFDCPATIGTIPGDERRLKQVMFSLVSNALKFTPAGGSVMVAARREGERVALIVSDTGIGVAAEDQARIFEKFERGNTRQSGAGLGLALVKSFIELHGGTVELRSSPREGTTVACWLNAALPVQDEGTRGQARLRAIG